MYAPLQKQNKAAAKTSSQGLARANRQPVNQPEHLTANLQDSRESQSATKTAHANPGGAGVRPTNGGTHFRHNFADIAVFHRPVRGIQAKLTVNVPGDAYEQEADRVAEQVMRMPEPQVAPTPQVSGQAAGVQRECACGGTCDGCKKKNHDEEHAKVQMKAAGPVNAGGMEAPPIVHEVLRSSGQPLDARTRAFMEPRFGHDFSKVRVHTDARAVESAKAVGARAYTVGSNVVFGAGEYVPRTQEGQRLLGHELTHVVQQGGKSSAFPALSTSPGINPESKMIQNAAPAAIVQRGPGPAPAAAPAAPGWLGKWQTKAVHLKGNIWDVKLPTLGDSWVGPYDELAAYIKEQGFSGKMEAAHIVGGEHLTDIRSSFSYDKAPCIAVDKTLHATWTKQTTDLQKGHLAGRKTVKVERTVPTRDDVIGLYNELYADHPELREMVRHIVRLPGKDEVLKSPMDAHQGTGMPKPQSPMDEHQGGMPKPQLPMDEHQGTGMPKPQSPMDAHQGAGMPKPQSPMDAHQGTGMPKPQSPMDTHEVSSGIRSVSSRGRIGSIAAGIAASALEALSIYLIERSVESFENDQIERWWKAQYPDMEAAIERRQSEIKKVLRDTNYQKTIYANIHMELVKVLTLFHTHSGSSWRWSVADLKFTGVDVSSANINRDDPSRVDMHIYGGMWYLPFTYSVAIAIPAPLVMPDIRRIHDHLAAIQAVLQRDSDKKTAGELVALDELNVALQATDFTNTFPHTPAERFQIASDAVNRSLSILKGQDEAPAAFTKAQLGLVKTQLYSLRDRWLAMVQENG